MSIPVCHMLRNTAVDTRVYWNHIILGTVGICMWLTIWIHSCSKNSEFAALWFCFVQCHHNHNPNRHLGNSVSLRSVQAPTRHTTTTVRFPLFLIVVEVCCFLGRRLRFCWYDYCLGYYFLCSPPSSPFPDTYFTEQWKANNNGAANRVSFV